MLLKCILNVAYNLMRWQIFFFFFFCKEQLFVAFQTFPANIKIVAMSSVLLNLFFCSFLRFFKDKIQEDS